MLFACIVTERFSNAFLLSTLPFHMLGELNLMFIIIIIHFS